MFIRTVILIFVLALTSVNASSTDIFNYVKRNRSLDYLQYALEITGLDETLKDDGPFTLLAPTDHAFEKLFYELHVDGLKDIPEDLLKTVLLYHVIGGEVYSKDLEDGIVKTVEGTNLRVDVGHYDVEFNNRAEVTNADIKASNGVIHKIDRVLLPPSNLIDIIKDDHRFDILYECLVEAGLDGAVEDGEMLTIFAPSDNDFRRLFHDLGVKGCDDVPNETLKDLLLYHVVGKNLLKDDLKDGDDYETLEGGRIHIETKYYGRKIYVNNAKILDANILASNGVIHEIDEVLEIK